MQKTFKVKLIIKENGKVKSVMVMESKCGMMPLVMKDFGKMTRQMGKGNSTILVETYLKENGKITWLMVLEGICI